MSDAILFVRLLNACAHAMWSRPKIEPAAFLIDLFDSNQTRCVRSVASRFQCHEPLLAKVRQECEGVSDTDGPAKDLPACVCGAGDGHSLIITRTKILDSITLSQVAVQACLRSVVESVRAPDTEDPVQSNGRASNHTDHAPSPTLPLLSHPPSHPVTPLADCFAVVGGASLCLRCLARRPSARLGSPRGARDNDISRRAQGWFASCLCGAAPRTSGAIACTRTWPGECVGWRSSVGSSQGTCL